MKPPKKMKKKNKKRETYRIADDLHKWNLLLNRVYGRALEAVSKEVLCEKCLKSRKLHPKGLKACYCFGCEK